MTVYWSFGIFPVQEWIAEARRSRDLRAGSALPSWITLHLLDQLRARGATVIIPVLASNSLPTGVAGGFSRFLSQSADYSYPNHASGSAPDGKAITDFFQAAPVEELWSDFVKEARESLSKSSFDFRSLVSAGLPAEIQCPFSLLWCVKEVPPSRNGLQEINRLFTATKRTRPLPIHRGHPVGKCVQCGRREAIGGLQWAAWRSFHEQLALCSDIRRGVRFDHGERLCVVCTVKRLGGYLNDLAVPSTSAIAARVWREQVRSCSDLRIWIAALEERARVLSEIGEDPAPLYYRSSRERLAAERRNHVLGRDNEMEAVEDATAKFQKEIVRHNHTSPENTISPEPSSYLAAVMFDGDNMGRVVQESSGEASSAVTRFASELRRRARERGVESFYLGGDEGLLLCPLEEALEFPALIQKLWGEASIGTTVSAGVALFHRERPLGAAIESCRGALRMAKSLEGKNSLSVSVHTASGNSFRVTGQWGEMWERLRAAIGLIRSGVLSAGWAYDVESFIEDLSVEAWDSATVRDAIRAEVRRLSGRRSEGGNVADESAASADQQEASVDAWETLKGESWWAELPSEATVHEIPAQLHLVGFLVRELTAYSERSASWGGETA